MTVVTSYGCFFSYRKGIHIFPLIDACYILSFFVFPFHLVLWMGPNRYYLLVASCMDAEVRKDEAIYNFSVCSLETLTIVMMHVGWPSTWLVSKLWGNLFDSGFFQNVSLVTVSYIIFIRSWVVVQAIFVE